MNTATNLLAGLAVALCVGACEQAQSTDELTPHTDYWDTPAAATHNPAPSHLQQLIGGQNGITDLVQKAADDAQEGTPDQVARMHAVQKIQYAMLGNFLSDLGVSLTASTQSSGNGGKNNKGGSTSSAVPSAGTLYSTGASALGAPIYPSRTPEMIIPSTSALAKEFDIFMAAAPEIVANVGNSTRCPGVTLVTDGNLTADGISCLIGKPSTPDHVTLAQQIVAAASDPTTGLQIAVATLLAAAHISE